MIGGLVLFGYLLVWMLQLVLLYNSPGVLRPGRVVVGLARRPPAGLRGAARRRLPPARGAAPGRATRLDRRRSPIGGADERRRGVDGARRASRADGLLAVAVPLLTWAVVVPGWAVLLRPWLDGSAREHGDADAIGARRGGGGRRSTRPTVRRGRSATSADAADGRPAGDGEGAIRAPRRRCRRRAAGPCRCRPSWPGSPACSSWCCCPIHLVTVLLADPTEVDRLLDRWENRWWLLADWGFLTVGARPLPAEPARPGARARSGPAESPSARTAAARCPPPTTASGSSPTACSSASRARSTWRPPGPCCASSDAVRRSFDR